MSIKEFEEVQSITVPVRKHVCDLCEKVIENGGCVISISAVNVYHESPLRPSQGRDWSDSKIEVCSTTCLTKNIGGATLLLDTKIIPSIEAGKTKYHPSDFTEKKCEEAPKNFSYH